MLVRGDEAVVEWVRKRLPTNVSTFGPCTAIGVVNSDNKLIAAVVYSNYRRTDIEISFASESPLWATRGNIKGMLSFPFFELNCRRVTALTGRDNDHVRNILKRLGFMHEGTLHDAGATGGDIVVYGMTKRYFLRSKWYGKQRRTHGATQPNKARR